METDNQVVAVFRFFHGIDDDVRTAAGMKQRERRRVGRPSRRGVHRLIQQCRGLYRAAFGPMPLMRIQGIRKFMLAAIGLRIRVSCRFQQRQANHIVLDVMAVFAIIQQTDPIPVLRQIDPLMTHRFKPG
ncbi:hypothetical protein D3C76_1220040 [compost metagenome]